MRKLEAFGWIAVNAGLLYMAMGLRPTVALATVQCCSLPKCEKLDGDPVPVCAGCNSDNFNVRCECEQTGSCSDVGALRFCNSTENAVCSSAQTVVLSSSQNAISSSSASRVISPKVAARQIHVP